MVKKLVTCPRSIHWNRAMSVLLIVALLVPLMVMAPAPDATPRTQPILLAMAAEQPEDSVRVIVQKGAKDTNVEDLLARLGGVVTKDLHIINAFAAEMPAKAVPELAEAAGVRWISFDAPVIRQGGPDEPMETVNLLNTYIWAIGADALWAEGYQGSGVTVAVVDSGIRWNFKGKNSDLNDSDSHRSRVLQNESFSTDSTNVLDQFGHGTHVAGIIGGNGTLSDGAYIGVAPRVNLLNIKVSDAYGAGYESDVVAGLQWIYEHEEEYDIRVVNISLNSSVPQSYHTSPLDAAVEILWFNGIVVVVSAGNNAVDYNGILYPPANDPFVITLGATDDQGTPDIGDDLLADFSAFGTTEEGFFKPDLVAPGTNIISLSAGRGARLAREHWDHQVGKYYFRMSGTSMASAVTVGGVALLLQHDPDLTPDQVKYRLMATARPFDSPELAGPGYLDIYAAVHGTTVESANTGIVASQLLWTGDNPVAWDSVNWNSVNWNSVNWNSVNWNSVNWNSVNWNSINWSD